MAIFPVIIALFWIGIIVSIVVKNVAKKNSYGRHSLSEIFTKQWTEVKEHEELHDSTRQYYTYSTQDPNFSFNGLPPNYDDFAELRKRNAAHEKQLQQRIYK